MTEAEAIFNRRFLAYFAAVLCLAAMSYVVAITFWPVPKDNQQYASTALGFILGTVFATPLAFHFGSSKSSQAKDDALRQQLSPPPLPVPPVPPGPTDPDGKPIVKVEADAANPLPVHDATDPPVQAGPRGALMTFRSRRLP